VEREKNWGQRKKGASFKTFDDLARPAGEVSGLEGESCNVKDKVAKRSFYRHLTGNKFGHLESRSAKNVGPPPSKKSGARGQETRQSTFKMRGQETMLVNEEGRRKKRWGTVNERKRFLTAIKGGKDARIAAFLWQKRGREALLREKKTVGEATQKDQTLRSQ